MTPASTTPASTQRVILTCRLEAYRQLSPRPEEGSRAAEMLAILTQAVADGDRRQYDLAETWLRSESSQHDAKHSGYGEVDWIARDPAQLSQQALVNRNAHKVLDAALSRKSFWNHPLALEQAVIDELLQSTARHQLPYPAHTETLLRELIEANSAGNEDRLKTAYVTYSIALRMQAELMLLRRRVEDNLACQQQKGAMTPEEKQVWLAMQQLAEHEHLQGTPGTFWPSVQTSVRRIKAFVGNIHLEQKRLPPSYTLYTAYEALRVKGSVTDDGALGHCFSQLEMQGGLANESLYVKYLVMARDFLHRATAA